MVHCGKQLGENITTEQGEHRLESFSWDSGPLLTVVPHVVTKQPLCSEPLGTVRTLKPLLCSNGSRKRGEGEVRKGPKQRVEHTEQQMRKKGCSYSGARNPPLQSGVEDTNYKAKRHKQAEKKPSSTCKDRSAFCLRTLFFLPA